MLFKLSTFSLFSKLYKISANDCFSVYSSNFMRFQLTSAFALTQICDSSEPVEFSFG